MDYCNLLISCLISHSDGTHSQDPLDVMLKFFNSVTMKKQDLDFDSLIYLSCYVFNFAKRFKSQHL